MTSDKETLIPRLPLEQKSCLVTGGTSGIGREIALGLAEMGAEVTLVGRSKDKCESTLRWLKSKLTSVGIDDSASKRISYLVADLSSQRSIRQLAKQYSNGHEKLDVLVNNAGIFASKRTVTEDGIELTFAVNHLAPFLLTNLLLDNIVAGRPSRIITTSSVAHRGAKIDFGHLQFEDKPYRGIAAYSQSKLANILFTKELARRLEGSGVTANCFHPGAVRTNLVGGDSSPWYYKLVWKLGSPFFLSPAKGADTAIYLASEPRLEKTGKYFVKRRQVQNSPQGDEMQVAKRLWDISVKLTGLKENDSN